MAAIASFSISVFMVSPSIRRMLGETIKTSVDKETKAATEQFFALYGIANRA